LIHTKNGDYCSGAQLSDHNTVVIIGIEFVLHVVETEIYKFKQIEVLRLLIMEEHTARDKDNNRQHANTVHLWIQLPINLALQQ
jgi:hypothetical protein